MSALQFFTGNGIFARSRTSTGKNPAGHLSGSVRFPEGHDEWVGEGGRYSWLRDGYLGNPYTVDEIKSLGLFRELNDNGDVIAETRRLTRDVQHVVDTDAQALASARLDLNSEDDAALEAGMAVWKRSRLFRQVGLWAQTGAMLGDNVIEAVRMNESAPFDTRLVAYDPQHCRLEYDDETGTELRRVIVTLPYFEGAEQRRGSGEFVNSERMRTYTRVLYPDRIEVYREGQLVEKESGPHGLGVVPAVHVPFIPIPGDPAHGLWAAQGLEYALAMMDSLMTQVQAIGNRHANPIVAARGFHLAANSDATRIGRVVSGIPANGALDLVESSLSGVGVLLDAVRAAREQVRETLPEFLFTEAGANASGSALNFRAAAFVAKMEAIRSRWYAALAQVTEYAVRMDRGDSYGQDDVFRIDAPPVLPVNKVEELKAINDAKDNGGLKRVDYVRHLQRIGIVSPEEDAQDYADAVRDEQAAEDERLAQTVLNAQSPTVTDDDIAVDIDDGADDEA